MASSPEAQGPVGRSMVSSGRENGRWGAQAPKNPKSRIFDFRAAQCGPYLQQLPHVLQIGWPLSSAHADFQLNVNVFFWQPSLSGSLAQSSPKQLNLQATRASVSLAKSRRMFAFSGESFPRFLDVPEI